MPGLEESVEFAENPEPRCPCVLLLDTSGSMPGEKLAALNEGTTASGFGYGGWFALAVTRNTPATEQERLYRWAQASVGGAGFANSSKGMGAVVPPAQSLSELDNFYQSEIERYRAQLKRLGLLA